MKNFISGLIFVVILLAGCFTDLEKPSNRASDIETKAVAKLIKQRNAVVRFFDPMTIKEGDWLDRQKEPGQTFEEYVLSGPTRSTKERNTIYIQPIGKFTREQAR